MLVAFGFLATWLPVELWTHSFPRLASSAYHQGVGAQRSWIDAAVGRDAHVGVLWSGGNDLSVWENEFWNRSVDRVYGLGGATLPGDMPETGVTADRSTGILHDAHGRPISDAYVLTSTSVALVGTRVASDPAKELVLYRVKAPARTTTQITGLYDEPVSPWSGGRVVWQRSQCTGGELDVRVSSDANLFRGTTQTLTIGGTTKARALRLVPSTSHRLVRVPLTSRGGVCRAAFAISPTRSPGGSDTRLLGLHFDVIHYLPPR